VTQGGVDRPREAFLRSKSGRAWLLLLGLVILCSIAAGGALYRSNVSWFETNKAEETATALRLVEAMVANYTDIRSDLLGEDAPVPAAFRAHAIDRFNAARDSDHQLQMDWLATPGREIATAPRDAATAAAISRAAEARQNKPSSGWLQRDGAPVFRTVAPSVASQQACVDCHNRYLNGRTPWQLGDIMGAFVIDVPAAAFLAKARSDAIVSAAVLFLVLASLSNIILLLQHRRHEAEIQADDSSRRASSAAEARLLAEAASDAKSRFLALMSHELRTPLNAILGFSEVIARQSMGPVPPRYAGYAKDIHDSGQILLALISDILDLAKAESGHLRLSEKEIPLFEIVDSCVRLIAPRAEAQKVEVTTALPEGVVLFVDPTKLRQTLLNLLTNAVKFTPEGGRVSVDAKLQQDGGLALRVTDSGIGIKPEEIPRALLPFERLEAAAQIEGTGLGLPLAKMLAELHDGLLELSSLPGRGTRATIHLPGHRVSRAARETCPAPADTAEARQGLFQEDDSALAIT
jgi:signal transduction histidine kinase